jgi:hypothetical protein
MRTKTLALSALLGMLGSASVMAQNVYSVNAVGYINVTIPPGFSIITAPLVASPDNTLNTLLPNLAVNGGNSPSTYAGLTVFKLTNGHFSEDVANSYSAGWVNGGTLTINPGTAVFLDSTFYPLNSGHNYTTTFVGSVPSSASGAFTNVITPGINLVGSIIPVTGDPQTSSILNLENNLVNGGNNLSTLGGDTIFFFDPTYNGHSQNGFNEAVANSYSAGWTGGAGSNGDPLITSVSEGFYFVNASSGNVNWVENFTLNP